MLCEKCQKNEATMHMIKVVNGETKEHHYCEKCVKENGIESPISLQDIFQGFLNIGNNAKGDFSAYKTNTVKCSHRSEEHTS